MAHRQKKFVNLSILNFVKKTERRVAKLYVRKY
jgi:hypothetical protein